MPDYNIAALKAQQDDFQARRKALLERFVPFWEGLIERLTEFTSEALSAGLLDVGACKLRSHYGEIQVAEVLLNGFNLLLVATDETNHLDDPKGPPSARVFLYPNDEPDARPTADFVAQEITSDTYRARGRFFGAQEIRPFFDGDVSRSAGHRAAEALIDVVYGFRMMWEERPELGILLDRNTPTASIGFKPPS